MISEEDKERLQEKRLLKENSQMANKIQHNPLLDNLTEYPGSSTKSFRIDFMDMRTGGEISDEAGQFEWPIMGRKKQIKCKRRQPPWGDSRSKFKQRLAEEEALFMRMRKIGLMYGKTPEEFRDKKKQKFRKRKLPFTK
jgi:hypothetical protein